MAPVSDITLKVQCHCGHATYKYTLPASAFPLKSALCHCQSCRQATGHLFATFAVIPLQERPDVSHLSEYVSSSSLRRYFCPQCGASVANFEQAEWEFASGMLNKTQGVLDRVQLFVDDTNDGGAAPWLAEGVSEMYSQNRQSKLITTEELDVMSSQGQERSTNEPMSASCCCGDVCFTISNGKEKYPAGLDACTSCRKVTGLEITAWATVPKASIFMNDGEQLNLNSAALKKYNTSVDVSRYFCRRCGATIFYLKDGRDTIDIGVGLLRANSGARAETLLSWEKYNSCVAYQEDATDPVLVQTLVAGIQRSRA